MTPAQIFEEEVQSRIVLPEYDEAAKDLNAIYQFQISGELGGDWNVNLQNKTVNRGLDPLADCTLSLSDQDLLRLIQGEISVSSLVLKRRMRVSGKMGPLLKLKKIFSLRSSKSSS